MKVFLKVNIYKIILAFFVCFFVMACSENSATKEVHPPEVFSSGDECHVCGMLITNLAGPKGQAFDQRSNKMKKFCSSFDLLSWYLQPENKPNVIEIYVHDMAGEDWQHPKDSKLISAKKAYYVLNSSRKGSMGKTVASFSNELDAEKFVKQWGGTVKSFEQLTIELLLD